jgi:hypothetical protein
MSLEAPPGTPEVDYWTLLNDLDEEWTNKKQGTGVFSFIQYDKIWQGWPDSDESGIPQDMDKVWQIWVDFIHVGTPITNSPGGKFRLLAYVHPTGGSVDVTGELMNLNTDSGFRRSVYKFTFDPPIDYADAVFLRLGLDMELEGESGEPPPQFEEQ